ncbi:hypothetical protein [Tumebacillus lipolyticus]|uniref:Uncharacterized protein n=1 Tax=Tumebacillus lipolyticus TaxID=1280370 RepID=A0ABW4ZSJ4_9BACL
MAKRANMMEFGYEERAEKGTLIALDSFERWTADDLARVVAEAHLRKFTKIVLFPHHEKTLKSMGESGVSPYHARVKKLRHLVDEQRSTIPIAIDNWEEKRKKYTPIELILRYFEESYRPPYFLYLSDRYANQFSAFASFEACIKKVRLLIWQQDRTDLTARLMQYSHRFDIVVSE